MKKLAVLAIMILSLPFLFATIHNVNASGFGLYKNAPPSSIERLKALNRARALGQGNLTDDFISQYSNSRMPSYTVQASMVSSPPVLVEILTAAAMTCIAVAALYLTFKDRRARAHDRDELLLH